MISLFSNRQLDDKCLCSTPKEKRLQPKRPPRHYHNKWPTTQRHVFSKQQPGLLVPRNVKSDYISTEARDGVSKHFSYTGLGPFSILRSCLLCQSIPSEIFSIFVSFFIPSNQRPWVTERRANKEKGASSPCRHKCCPILDQAANQTFQTEKKKKKPKMLYWKYYAGDVVLLRKTRRLPIQPPGPPLRRPVPPRGSLVLGGRHQPCVLPHLPQMVSDSGMLRRRGRRELRADDGTSHRHHTEYQYYYSPGPVPYGPMPPPHARMSPACGCDSRHSHECSQSSGGRASGYEESDRPLDPETTTTHYLPVGRSGLSPRLARVLTNSKEF
jgi:hypothetical protein